MEQRSLDLVTRRRARQTDPSTSHEAAANNAPRLNAQAARVLSLIERYPGHTACELAQRETRDPAAYVRARYMISRRASELRAMHLVRSGTPRRCTVAGSNQMIWYTI